MISFIQRVLQKHNRWILGTLLGVIIVAFVFTVGAAPGIVGKRRAAMFYGKNLLSRREMQPAINAALISASAAKLPLHSKQQLDYLVLFRCALLAQADKLQIKPADDKTLAKFVKTLPEFCDEKNEFSEKKYNAFVAECERSGFSKSEIKMALFEDQRIDILKKAIVGSGILFEYQLRKALSFSYSDYDLAIADMDYDSFAPEINVTDGDMQEFYEAHRQRYTLPEMVAVSIVRFEADKFEKDLQMPEESALRKYFDTERKAFAAYSDFESARSEIIAHYLRSKSQKLAGQSADEFVGKLYGSDVKLNSEEWQDLLFKFEVKKEKVAAYSKFKLPTVEGVPEVALISVCDMDPSRYYSDPFVTDFGAAVLIVEGRRGTRNLPFGEVKEDVKKDVYREKKANLFGSFTERVKNSVAGTTQSGVTNNFAKFKLLPQFFHGVSFGKDADKFDGNYWKALGFMADGEHVCSAQTKNGVAIIVVLDRKTPPYADMKTQDNGKIEAKLRAFDRDFCFSEYSGWLVNRELSEIK
ncbi:MAG: peptidyl-prolyl cis-trans isomerase [Puniceicoccales bacterium]|jgi:peptidyl-prolyl cis-trans isomerase D|nr:peptidyl-prolyl cis-trans isomerase [Puniceicoccales bacterium]